MFQMFVRCLDFCDLVNMLQADCPDGVMSGTAGALFDARRFHEEVCGRGRFRDEGESALRLDGNQGGNGNPRLNVRSASIEFFAEVHRLYAAGTESRTHWRRGCGLASRDEKTLPTGPEVRRR